jgi:multiple sugar transport system ATP-binding protein
VVTQAAPRDRDIAMVFQNYALYPHMTVRRNMTFGLELRYGGGLPARAMRRIFRPRRAAELAARRDGIGARVRAVAQTLSIEHLLDRLPGQLSGGERQRVALGRAIVREPAAFLFDEPLSNLDAQLRVEMRKELKQLHQRLKTTMIYVTHDQVEALTLGQRVAVMNRGTLQQVGPARDVYDRPANRFVAGFLGTPPMNFVSGGLVWREDRIQFVSRAWRTPLPAALTAKLRTAVRGAVVLGVRPEDVRLMENEKNNATVTLVEPLGDSALAYLELDDAEDKAPALVAKVDARRPLANGDRARVECAAERVHLFDAASGVNLALNV